MTWAAILLADSSASLRLLVFRDLLHYSADDEVRELKALHEKDPIVRRFLTLQDSRGSFRPWEGTSSLSSLRLTAQALMGLGYLGFGPEHPAVHGGAEYIFAQQRNDGSWPITKSVDRLKGEGYSMIPIQTALPLLGLAWGGYAADPRAERAYEWLLDKQLPDGGWPSGVKRRNYVFAAGYRWLAHSKWGCRTNTTAAVSALALHPKRRKSREARRGLDLLLVHGTRQAHTLGFEVARTIGFEPPHGSFTYYARYDVAQILDLSWRIGASLDDARIAENVEFVKGLQGQYGLWDYPSSPRASRWVTFDLLRSLSRLDKETDWFSMEPRTPFQPYPKRRRRF
jgi:hypothetical protein